jgi:hypothetical protein
MVRSGGSIIKERERASHGYMFTSKLANKLVLNQALVTLVTESVAKVVTVMVGKRSWSRRWIQSCGG